MARDLAARAAAARIAAARIAADGTAADGTAADGTDRAATCAALADPTRRALLARLAKGEATVQDLAHPFAISQPTISRHLKVLQDAGSIETRIQGTARPRRLKPDTMGQLRHWLDQYRALWEAQFQRLDAVLDTLPDAAPEGQKP